MLDPAYAKEICRFVEWISLKNQLFKLREIRFHISADIPSQNNITIKQHTDVVDCNGQMIEVVLPYPAAFCILFFQPFKKGIQFAIALTGQNIGIAVTFQTPSLSAVTQLSSWDYGQMTDLTASGTLAFVNIIVDQYSAANIIVQSNIEGVT